MYNSRKANNRDDDNTRARLIREDIRLYAMDISSHTDHQA